MTKTADACKYCILWLTLFHILLIYFVFLSQPNLHNDWKLILKMTYLFFPLPSTLECKNCGKKGAARYNW